MDAIVVGQPSPAKALQVSPVQAFKDAARSFLSKGIPIAKACESASLTFHLTQYLTSLPHDHGALALVLLQGLQHEWLAQAMYLQDHITKALVSGYKFPSHFNRFSLGLISRELMYELPSVEFKTALVKLFESQDTVFHQKVVLLDQTSLHYFLYVQSLYYDLFPAENQLGVAFDTARIVAYDLLALSSYITDLIHFATNILQLPYIGARLLEPPQLPPSLLHLTLANTPPSPSCVKSHRIRFNAMVRLRFTRFPLRLCAHFFVTLCAGAQGRRVYWP